MASHTTTGEWKSFELRMRRRRAERLVLRAHVAAAAGYAEDARLSLAEARRLAPGLAAIDAVEETLDRLPAPPAPAPTRRWRGAAIVAATLAAVAFAVSPRPHPIVPAHSLQTILLEPPAVTDPPLDPIAPAPPPPQPHLPAMASATHESGATEDEAPATPMTKATTSPMPAVAPLVRERIDPPPRPIVPPVPERHAEPGAPIPVIGDVVAVAVAVEALPASSVPSPSLPAPAPPARTPPTDAGVRTALDRYAAAYSALDADAAERVWPGVNRAALTRAFDGLLSQRISLGDCRIDVGGATARASCAGSATWTPKIGGGAPHTEARLWMFDLARAGADWQIVNARVQNR
jgi:hypothetical protein